ncbi:uncharacterized protein LOC113770645 [Coffea eugenioides]|uniref:Uncharacterized protein n=1 Tax=Coffea arabica TaxID=13443 RepID=A0A6P6XM95_COFAR|nr:uncharacterized protein LOC113743379 [Coffea arabica]XP_027170969.1 uncharacterized protein LOC113770645 [Coffea eugenioides]
MGVWDLINSTTEAVKRNAPAPAAVIDACKASYGYSSAVVGNIDNAVRVNGMQALNDYMPSEETRSRISLFASKFTQNAARHALREGYKLIPGGKAVAEIISETMNDVKSENLSTQKMMAVTQVTGSGGGGKVSAGRNLLDRVEMQSRGLEMGSANKGNFAAESTANQTPEDVLRIFMMKEFMGKRFADDLILPQIMHGIKTK